MDLHVVTLAVGEGNFSGFRSTRVDSPRRGDEDSLGNYSDDALPPRLSDIGAAKKRLKYCP
jgi:hypothetical protein